MNFLLDSPVKMWAVKSASEKGVIWKRGLFRELLLPVIVEILDILESRWWKTRRIQSSFDFCRWSRDSRSLEMEILLVKRPHFCKDRFDNDSLTSVCETPLIFSQLV